MGEEIVAHSQDLLVGPHLEEAEKILFVFDIDIVEVERVVDVERDLAVAVAGDIPQARRAGRVAVEPVERHDREVLAQTPVVGKRLEERKVDQIALLHAVENSPDLPRGLAPEQTDRLFDDQVNQRFGVGAVGQIDIPEIEKCQQRLHMIEGVVKVFAGVFGTDGAVKIVELLHQRRVVLLEPEPLFAVLLAEKFENRRDEYGVAGGDVTARFGEDRRFGRSY